MTFIVGSRLNMNMGLEYEANLFRKLLKAYIVMLVTDNFLPL